MKAVGYAPAASTELADAIAASPDPARFDRTVEDALRDVASGLIQHALYPGTSCRQCPLPGLPYAVIYTETADEIRVIAVAHHSRRPGYWKRRLRNP